MLALLGLAVFSTAFAFVIYFRLIQTLGSVGTTAQAYLRVPIGVALGVLFLGERAEPTAWIGLACVVIGVAAMTIPASEAEAGRGGGREPSSPAGNAYPCCGRRDYRHPAAKSGRPRHRNDTGQGLTWDFGASA